MRSSLGLGALLVALTAINVYYFFLRHDTSVGNLMKPVSTSKTLSDSQSEALADSIPPSLLGAAYDGKKAHKPAAQESVGGAGSEDNAILGQIGPSDTLSTVLAREGFGSSAAAVTAALAKLVDPKLIRAGEKYQVDRDDEGTPASFEYVPTPVLRYQVTHESDGSWKAKKHEKPIEIKAAQAYGTVESSLYESAYKAGESGALVSLIVDLFAWDINFYTDTHPGDRWKVIVEKQYLGGQFYKYGKLLAAEYSGKTGTFRGFYWNPSGERGRGHYYDEKGQALAKSMLKTPLRYVRVSSKFDLKRFHPILHTVRAHLGVDYAAPVGTPVWAPAGGKVVQAEMMRGSGNTIAIQHAGGLQTRYFHLSRFAKGLKVGKQVQQKEIIGFVGTTGLSTGPHLHFSVVKNGQYIDPDKLSVQREAGPSNRAAYLDAVRPRVAILKSLPPVVAKN
ncbi:MAG TPA: peptidoglycan DD-metalloendopeptidase family protein [Polyangia bacterium]